MCTVHMKFNNFISVSLYFGFRMLLESYIMLLYMVMLMLISPLVLYAVAVTPQIPILFLNKISHIQFEAV